MQLEILKFLEFLAVEKGRSSNTIAAYRNDLNQFLFFLNTTSPVPVQIKTWGDIQPALVQRYLDFLQTQTYASSTVARKIAAVKSFLGHLQAQGEILHDPIGELTPPKVEKNLPRPIAPEAVQRLLAEPGKSKSPKGLRDGALLKMLYATGMRVSELVNLNVEDVDTETGTVTCGAGSKRKRIVPVEQETTAALERYLSVGRRALLGDIEEPALFLNHRGSRLTRQGLWLIIREYVEAVGMEEQVTPLTLRHTFATHLLNAGAKLKEVQMRLGHASASTTQLYRRLSEESASELTIDGAPLPPPHGGSAQNGWTATAEISD